MDDQPLNRRYFTTYSGVGLPLKLMSELDDASLGNRITYFIGHFDEAGRLAMIEKSVYGEIEFVHRYEYRQDGSLSKALLIEDEDEPPRTLKYHADGRVEELEGD